MTRGLVGDTDHVQRAGKRDDVAAILRSVQRLIAVALIAGVGYWLLTSGTRSYCPDSPTSDGAGSCVSLALSPSPFALLLLVAATLLALNRASSRADALDVATRLLNRTAIALLVGALVAAGVAHVWYWVIPIEEFYSGSFGFMVPFPVGLIELTVGE